MTKEPKNGDPLFLDFQGQQIEGVKINEEFVKREDITFEKHRIHLPRQFLKLNERNVVEMCFSNSYVTNSAGLHFHKDPQDGKTYVFSHLEPFFCHRFFPCFDQPSVRAPLKLSVMVPNSQWNVIANGEENGDKNTRVSLDSPQF